MLGLKEEKYQKAFVVSKNEFTNASIYQTL